MNVCKTNSSSERINRSADTCNVSQPCNTSASGLRACNRRAAYTCIAEVELQPQVNIPEDSGWQDSTASNTACTSLVFNSPEPSSSNSWKTLLPKIEGLHLKQETV